MEWLFVKTTLAWPRTSGHDLRTYNLAKHLVLRGESVRILTVDEPSVEALADLVQLGPVSEGGVQNVGSTWLQRRFRRYWGASEKVRSSVRNWKPDGDGVVVGVGLDALPYVAEARGVLRVWYAGDEWIKHHLSLLGWKPDTWSNIRMAATKGLYERSFRKALDLVWVVAPGEATPMRWLAGIDRVDVLANGVDSDFYACNDSARTPGQVVFWGRLDFEPNVHALQWFVTRIWPTIHASLPETTFKIVGMNATPEVRRLAGTAGVALLEDVADLRPLVLSSAAVVLPMRSGAGIKNKLLEAAAMARPIVCTPLATGGLRGQPPLIVAAGETDWIAAVVSLLKSPDEARRLGRANRAWVVREHSWQRTADDAMTSATAALREVRNSHLRARLKT